MIMGKSLKTALLLALAGVLACALCACGSSQSSSTSTTSSSSSKAQMDGYDTSTNTEVTLGNLKISLPSYYGDNVSTSDDNLGYKIDSSKALLAIGKTSCTEAEYKKLGAENFAEAANNFKSNLDLTFKEGKSITVGGLSGATYSASTSSVYAHGIKCFDADTKTAYIFLFIQDTTAEKSYTSDYSKVLNGITYVESAVSADFKETMDEYEEFFDSYVEILKKYKENPSDLSILSDYATSMSKYATMMSKMESLKSDLSGADLAYYLEVTARITKKLAEVA